MNEVVNEVTGDAIRAAMRRVPSVVTVVTVGAPEPRGITIGSFVTVSLEPPLVSFNVQRKARMHDQMTVGRRFAIHVLSADQAEFSNLFADPDLTGAEQLRRSGASTDAAGIPALPGALIRFECKVKDLLPAGDHSIVLGTVKEISRRNEGHALLYFDRDYRSLSEGEPDTTNLGSSASPKAPEPKNAKS